MPPCPMNRTIRKRAARTAAGASEGGAPTRPPSRGEEVPGATTPAAKVSSSWGSSGDATGRILSDGLVPCAGAHAHGQPRMATFRLVASVLIFPPSDVGL